MRITLRGRDERSQGNSPIQLLNRGQFRMTVGASGTVDLDEPQELSPRACIVAEVAEHRR